MNKEEIKNIWVKYKLLPTNQKAENSLLLAMQEYAEQYHQEKMKQFGISEQLSADVDKECDHCRFQFYSMTEEPCDKCIISKFGVPTNWTPKKSEVKPPPTFISNKLESDCDS